MGQQSVVSFEIDEEAMKAFEEFCLDVGMSASVAVSLFVKAVIREQRIPFEIASSAGPFYSPANQERLRRSLEQLNAGLGVERALIEDAKYLLGKIKKAANKPGNGFALLSAIKQQARKRFAGRSDAFESAISFLASYSYISVKDGAKPAKGPAPKLLLLNPQLLQ